MANRECFVYIKLFIITITDNRKRQNFLYFLHSKKFYNRYTSELWKIPLLLGPPITKTSPFVNMDAVCDPLLLIIFAVRVQNPVVGSYNSTVFK